MTIAEKKAIREAARFTFSMPATDKAIFKNAEASLKATGAVKVDDDGFCSYWYNGEIKYVVSRAWHNKGE